MTRKQILEKLEEIQEDNSKLFMGSNEAELHTREDIADWIHNLYNAIKRQ